MSRDSFMFSVALQSTSRGIQARVQDIKTSMSKRHLVTALCNATRRLPSLRASRKPLSIGLSTPDKLKHAVHNGVVRGHVGGNPSDATAWKSFVAAGSLGLARVEVHQARDRVKLWWIDGHESEFSLKWIRDNSPDSFSGETYQREVRCLHGACPV